MTILIFIIRYNVYLRRVESITKATSATWNHVTQLLGRRKIFSSCTIFPSRCTDIWDNLNELNYWKQRGQCLPWPWPMWCDKYGPVTWRQVSLLASYLLQYNAKRLLTFVRARLNYVRRTNAFELNSAYFAERHRKKRTNKDTTIRLTTWIIQGREKTKRQPAKSGEKLWLQRLNVTTKAGLRKSSKVATAVTLR